MARIELVLRKKPNAKGKLPITLKITTAGENPSFIYLGHYIDLNDWDEKRKRVKKTHPNWARINSYINKRLDSANDEALDLVTKKKQASAAAIKKIVQPPLEASATFFIQSDLYLENLVKAQKFNEWAANKSRLERFKIFLKGKDTPFSEITIPMLEDFKIFVKSFKVTDRTVLNHLSAIRSVYSFALKNEIISKENYPFGKKGIKIKFPKTAKIGLNEKELERLFAVELTKMPNHARNLWVLSYLFAGMRIGDVLRLKWSDFKDGRLYYGMSKNDKLDSLIIPDGVEEILEQYRPQKKKKNDLIFPELKGIDLNDEFNVQRLIAYNTSRIDKFLRKYVAPAANISKRLTMHIARHTFANRAGNKIPIQILQLLYRHTVIQTTIDYQNNFIHEHKDEALKKVLALEPK